MKSSVKYKFLFCASVILLSTAAQAGSVFSAPSYSAAITFSEIGGQMHTMGITYDGSSYWSVGGGSANQPEYQFNSTGGLVAIYNGALDFRSIFTGSGSTVYARAFANNTIYTQGTTPGTFTPYLNLAGSALDAQSNVSFNGTKNEFIASSGGTVQRWDLSGNYIGSVTLNGWGTVSGESNYPADRGVVGVGNNYLTYSNGVLSAWDASGNRVDQTTLLNAGTSFNSHFSLSYANGMIFVADGDNGQWRGFQIAAVPEPETYAMMMAGLGLLGFMARRKKTA